MKSDIKVSIFFIYSDVDVIMRFKPAGLSIIIRNCS